MTSPLPRWLMLRYARLWRTFGESEFTFRQAGSALSEDPHRVSVILSELKKRGWLTVSIDPADSRRRIYRLRNPIKCVEELGEEAWAR